MKYLIRTDSSNKIGTGHVMRCLQLAKSLKELGNEVVFVTQRLPGNINDKIVKNGFSLIEVESLQDISFLNKNNNASLIIDHYELDFDWEKKVAPLVERIIIIDDHSDKEHFCDFYINPNNTFITSKHLDSTLILNGFKFAFIDSNFINIKKNLSETVTNVLVCMGGSDPTNELSKCLKAFSEHTGITFHFIVGISNNRADEIAKISAKHDNFVFYHNCNDLPELLQKMDLAITAAGSMLKELLCAGLPTISISTHHLQIEIAKKLANDGATEYVGHYLDADSKKIEQSFSKLVGNFSLRKELSSSGQKIFDGLGIKRVSKILNIARLSLREVEMKDAKITYTWRTHPKTLKFSGNSNHFDYESHVNWLESALKDENKILLLASEGMNDVGVIRFDLLDEGQRAVISIYLNPDYQGKGYGALVIQMGIKWLKKNHCTPITLIAKIHQENYASNHIFRSAGFIAKEENIMSKSLT